MAERVEDDPTANRAGTSPVTAALPFGVKLSFGIGAIGEAVFISISNTFIMIYYNQVIGMQASLVGFALMLALIADAITDPVVGLLSDRHRSRLGRRHPFLWAAPLPMGLALYAVFNPPELVVEYTPVLFVWLALWTILSRGFVTMFNVPHLALGGELSKVPNERSQLFSLNMVFTYLAGSVFTFSVWSFFSGDRVRASDGASVPGQLDPAAYLPVVLFVCAVVVISIWICAAGTAKAARELSQRREVQPEFTVAYFFKSLLSTFENRNYLILLVGYFFFMITSGIYNTMHVYLDTYFWELEPGQIRWFGVVAVLAGISGAIIAPRLMRLFDRKPVMLAALLGAVLFAQLVVDLRLLDLMPENGDALLMPCLLANAVGFHLSIGVAGVAIYSMIGDVIDENELATGLREEGLFYSARAFFSKAAYSCGLLSAGIMLDLFVRFPTDAIPGEITDGELVRLGITAGPVMAASAFLSVFIYAMYNLNRKRHAEIIDQLAQRQA